jgi:hypothetical protein
MRAVYKPESSCESNFESIAPCFSEKEEITQGSKEEVVYLVSRTQAQRNISALYKGFGIY